MPYPDDPRPFRADDDPRDPVVDELDADRVTSRAAPRDTLTGQRREGVAVEDHPPRGTTDPDRVRQTPTEPMRHHWDDDAWPPLGATTGLPTLSEPHHAGGDVIEKLQGADQRARLLLAIAVMTALTLLLVLVTFVAVLAGDRADEPVMVDGVPCLIQEGEGDQAVLYCQR